MAGVLQAVITHRRNAVLRKDTKNFRVKMEEEVLALSILGKISELP